MWRRSISRAILKTASSSWRAQIRGSMEDMGELDAASVVEIVREGAEADASVVILGVEGGSVEVLGFADAGSAFGDVASASTRRSSRSCTAASPSAPTSPPAASSCC